MESEEQDYTSRMCSLILIYTLRIIKPWSPKVRWGKALIRDYETLEFSADTENV